MPYKFNPFLGGLDNVAEYSAFTIQGQVADETALNALTPSVGDVYQVVAAVSPSTTPYEFFLWDGTAWQNLGTLGTAGPTGATGPTGADGQTILNGTVNPTDNVTGTDGDFYINTTTNEIFGPRSGGLWGSGTSLVGPGGGATVLGDLNDVDLATTPPVNTDALVYDGANWVPGSPGASAIGDLTDVTITAPSAWQVLGYNTTSGEWENTSHIHGSLAGSLYIHIKNTDSVQLDKGTPFYITGTVGASDQVEVQAADNTDPAKGPAVGLVEEDLIVNGEGDGVLVGEIFNYDTATPGWSTNDALYVSTAGTITNVKPSTGYRQVVGYVGRVHTLAGTIIVLGNQADPVAGSNGQIQFNDDGGFGADAALTFNKTTDELRLAGDINLDSGGTFSTTIQSVTPTANRTISFPDQTGTVGLVSGATGNIQFNDAGKLAGSGDLNIDLDWNNASTVFTGLKVNVTDTFSAASSSILDLQSGGTSVFSVGKTGALNIYAIGTNTPTGAGIGSPATSFLANRIGGRWNAAVASDRFVLESTTWLGFSLQPGTNNNFGTAANVDTRLYRDAAGTLAQRHGTNAQTYRLYNTFTDASNYQRTSINDDSTGLIINQEYAGTGAVRTNLLDLQDNGSSKITFKENELAFDTGTTSIYAGASGAGSQIRIGGNGTVATIPLDVGYSNITIANRATLGFTSGNDINSGTDTGLKRDSAGVVAITDGSTGTGYVKQTPVLVSALPAAATVGAGTRGFVSDATATTFASVVTGSGTASTAGTVPVYSDGTDWRIG